MSRSEPVARGEFLSVAENRRRARAVCTLLGHPFGRRGGGDCRDDDRSTAPFVLDLFVTLNIAAAVTLLLIAIYVSEVLRIATFPRCC